MNNQIRITLYENGIEKDFIGRDIPVWDEYNFPKGLLIDLSLLLNRNSLLSDWLLKQFIALKLLER